MHYTTKAVAYTYKLIVLKQSRNAKMCIHVHIDTICISIIKPGMRPVHTGFLDFALVQ